MLLSLGEGGKTGYGREGGVEGEGKGSGRGGDEEGREEVSPE